MKKIFDVQEYDSWYDRHRDIYEAELKAIKPFVDKYGPPRLEIGVGTGRFSQPLNIDYGIDPDEDMLRIASSRGIKTVKGVGEDLPFPDEFFEMVLIATTLPFFGDAKKVIRECWRVLKKDGGLIIAFIPQASYFGRKYRRMGEEGDERFRNTHFYTFEEVKELLKGLFEIVGVRSTLLGEKISLEVVDGHRDDASFVVVESRKI